VISDSIITQAALGQGITVAGNLDVTNDTNLQGSLLADSLEVSNDSVFTGSARFNSTIKDTSGGVGTNGQVLTSTGTGVAWTTDAGGSVTGTGTTNYIAKWNTSSSIQDSIIFDNGTNVGIGTTVPTKRLHVSASDGNAELILQRTGAQASLWGLKPYNADFFIRENSTDRVTIKAGGNVGIGTSFPTEKLDIYSDGNAVVRLESAGGGVGMLDVGTDFTINNRINTNLIFKTSNAERMRITNNGSVGIGTTSPSYKLQVNGTIATNNTLYFTNNTATIQVGANWSTGLLNLSNGPTVYAQFDVPNGRIKNNLGKYLTASSQDGIFGTLDNFATAFVTNNTEKMRITNTGNVGIGTASPDRLLSLYSNNTETTPRFLIEQNGTGDAVMAFSLTGSQGWSMGIDNSLSDSFMIHNSAGGVDSSSQFAINTSGNVGIGTISPTHLLTLETASSPGLKIKDTTQGATLLAFSQDSNSHIGTYSAHPLVLDTNSSERMRITSTGNVGIGTTSPVYKLDVDGSAVRFKRSNKELIINPNFAGSNEHSQIEAQAGMELSFATNGSVQAMRIDTSGNVGVGTTSPSEKLDVEGNVKVGVNNGFYINNQNVGIKRTSNDLVLGGFGNVIIRSSSTTVVNQAERMRITSAGNVGIGTTSPAFKTTIYSSSITDSFPLVVGQGNAPNEFVGIGLSGFTASNGAVKAAMVLDRNGTYGVGDIHFLNNITQDNTNATLSDSRLVIRKSGNVGIGTTGPASKLAVDGGDIEVDDSASGLILRSPNGTRYRIQVDNSGNLTTTAV
jgi:hypothetical protein